MLTAADKPIPVLLHEADAGQPCLVCEDECPGLEIHFWRKICINCKCPASDHQAPVTAQPPQVRRGKQLEDNVRAQFECGKYSWIPPDLSPALVEEYMKQLPPEQRPLVGSVGEQYRRKLLMTQLPAHDHTPNEGLSRAQAEELTEFSRLRYEMSHGVGQVRPITSQEADMFDCRTCQSPLVVDQLGVFTDRAGPACIWCVGCFKCDVCQEPLVDLHYFYKDGELFCGRHHAELLKPRCYACDELILAKEYTLAEDRNWHIDHFCCWECDSPLGGQRYVTRDDHPFCILCYEELFAPPCKKCMLPIGLDSAHMVHREHHWHATESCFYCENCQVSLITSPFLFKFEEIFCSSTCAQQYAVTQLSDDPPKKHPQIEVIEDNPVDRSRVQSILRKESTPSPPKENGLPHKRKVMFDVSRDLLEPEDVSRDLLEPEDGETSEIKRSYSEEEFEYLEQSLSVVEHHVTEGHSEEYQDSPEDHEDSPDDKESPISASSLSESPFSESEQSPFQTPDISVSEPDIDQPEPDFVQQEPNIVQPEPDIVQQEPDIIEQEPDIFHTETTTEDMVTAESQLQETEEAVVVPEISVNDLDIEEIKQETSDAEPDICQTDTTSDDIVTAPHGIEETGGVLEKEADQGTQQVETTAPPTPDIIISDPVFPEESIGVTPGAESIVERVKEERVVEKEERIVEKENLPQRTRTLSNNDVEELKPPKKPARNKLSSASFNRVLRKIDHTSNETMFLERPGKRLKNRPRSMSSLNSHNRPQNTLEQRENLMSMYALAPDIADMVASVYQNQHSIHTTSHTTSHTAPDRDENRTLGASPTSCTTGTPRTGVRRNPSYEAAEFVMQLDVESEEEEEEEENKQTTFLQDESDPVVTDVPVKSPKKGMKERLSFRKKKDKSRPQKANLKSLPPEEVERKRTKKACVVM